MGLNTNVHHAIAPKNKNLFTKKYYAKTSKTNTNNNLKHKKTLLHSKAFFIANN